MLNSVDNKLINDNIFYKKDNYIFFRLNYINPKDFKLLKKNLQNLNYSLVFFSKKNLKNFLLKNNLNVNNDDSLLFLKEFKTSKIYYICAIDNGIGVNSTIFFKEVLSILNNSLKNSSYSLLFTKFTNDFLRPFYLNKNILNIFNLNNFLFIFYFLQLFLILDFLLLFFYFEKI